MERLQVRILVLTVAVIAVVALSTSAMTESNPGSLRFTGTVSEIGGDSLIVRVGDRKLQLEDISGAKIIIAGIGTPMISDIGIGDRIRVTANRISGNVYDARTIEVIGRPSEPPVGRGPGETAFPQRFSLVGVIAETDPTARTFVVRTMGGRSYTVDASDSQILLQGQRADFSTLSAGDDVRVFGSISDSRIKAENVNQVTVGYVGQQTALIGTITSLRPADRVLVMTRANRLVNVLIPEGAQIIMYGQPINLSNIPSSANVKVKGRWTNSDTVNAEYIEVYPIPKP